MNLAVFLPYPQPFPLKWKGLHLVVNEGIRNENNKGTNKKLIKGLKLIK